MSCENLTRLFIEKCPGIFKNNLNDDDTLYHERGIVVMFFQCLIQHACSGLKQNTKKLEVESTKNTKKLVTLP
jgi:hypothetical protein